MPVVFPVGWLPDELGHAFKTSLEDLHFHDLRRTAVTRLALSNCSLPKIASIDAHDLGSRVELAESVVKKLSQVYDHK
jgi:hypothetical protein